MSVSTQAVVGTQCNLVYSGSLNMELDYDNQPVTQKIARRYKHKIEWSKLTLMEAHGHH